MRVKDRLQFLNPLMDSLRDKNRRVSTTSAHSSERRGKVTCDKARLLDEVHSGKCVLSLDSEGNLLRSVLLVVVRMLFDGRILMQIAEVKNDAFSPKCMLPGGKILEG